jgi:VanZ family protein
VVNKMCARLPFILWLLALTTVIVGSLLPGAIAARIPLAALHLTDKDAHFLMYAVLALLSLLAFDRVPTGLMWALGAVPLGVALEFAQRLVPGRSYEVADMIADALGVCAGLAIAAALRVGKLRAA